MKKLFRFMLLFATVLIFTTSCSKDDEVLETTYTFVYNVPTPYFDASVILFEYNNVGDKISNNSIECENGYSKTFVASQNAEKIKVNVDGKWVQQVFFLNKGGNLVIELNGNSIIGKEEP